MERMQHMNELQIQEKVEDLAGKSVRILDCEQNTLNQTEEVLLVNGRPISLYGEEGLKIKKALILGEVPPCDLVNNMLIRAGIENNPVELETTVNVKSSVKTREQSQLVDSNGILLGANMNEKDDQDQFQTVNLGTWKTELTKTSAMEHVPGSVKNFIQGKPEAGKLSCKKSAFSPSKLMKGNKSNAEPSGQDQHDRGSHKSGSQLVPLHSGDKSKSSFTIQPPSKLLGEDNPSANNVDNLWDLSLKSQKNKKILSFFLKRKCKESKKSPQKPGDSGVGTVDVDQGAKLKSLPIMPSSTASEKSKKKKKQSSSKNSSVVEPKYDSIVHSSAAIMSTHPKFKKNTKTHDSILDPALSLISVDVDHIPARVTYETFV